MHAKALRQIGYSTEDYQAMQELGISLEKKLQAAEELLQAKAAAAANPKQGGAPPGSPTPKSPSVKPEKPSLLSTLSLTFNNLLTSSKDKEKEKDKEKPVSPQPQQQGPGGQSQGQQQQQSTASRSSVSVSTSTILAEVTIAECVACLDGPPTHLCVPCMHMALCEKCINMLRTNSDGQQSCPVCSTPMDDAVKVHR